MYSHKISIAPMMGCTDKHARYFFRLITKQVLLYTEMITTGAILHGDQHRLLGYNPEEHPLALQLGSNNPDELEKCTRLAFEYGYDEVNLNVGCPSDRVKSGEFGASLMLNPQLVASCVSAMLSVGKLPVTVKCRTGVDHHDSYDELVKFISMVSDAGCETFIVHARKAWLNGLSPKQNREVPPLKYDFVYQLKNDFPRLKFILNGGVTKVQDIRQHLGQVDGVMLGRVAYNNPYCLSEIDNLFFDDSKLIKSRYEVAQMMIPYIEREMQQKDMKLHWITRHMQGLFQGCPGARSWRKVLCNRAAGANANVEHVLHALSCVQEHHSHFRQSA